jgi:hypothetical protein
MSKLNLEELKAKVAKLTAANLVKIKETAEMAKLEAIIKLESSESLLNAKARLMVSGEATKQLETLIAECSAIIVSMPVHNTKTRENRKWNGSHRYGFGNQVDALFELATGIMYSCQEHKELLLSHTRLNMELLTQMVEAFGNPSYYSRNNNVVVEAKAADVVELNTIIQVLQSELGLTIDTSKLTANNFELESVKAEIKAAKENEDAQEAIEEADLEL